MSTHFSTLLPKFDITHAPRTKWSPRTNGKVEIQNKHLSEIFRCYLSQAGNYWTKLTCQFAFAQNTSLNSSTGTTPDEMFLGFKPQIPISLKWGLVGDDNELCQPELSPPLPNHTHVNKETSPSCMDNLLSSENSMDLLNNKTQFKNIYRKVNRKVYRKVQEASHRSLSYRNNYKFAKPLQKVWVEK